MEWTSIVDCAYDCTISLGAATTTCQCSIQLLDFAGNDLAVRGSVTVYTSSDATGDVPVAVTSLAAGTDGGLIATLATYLSTGISETDGDLDVVVDGTGDQDVYLNVVLPNGKIVTSAIIEITG